MTASAPIVLGITGASGAPYALRLLRALVDAERDVWLVVSAHGLRLLDTELGVGSMEAVRDHIGKKGYDQRVTVFDNADRGARPASGSALTAGMAIVPCSLGTLSAIATGASRSLIERAADVTLKERRRLVVVPRETPLSAIHLENMLRITRAGAVVLPAAPGFYHRPTRIEGLVDFIVARILDQLEVPNTLAPRWSGDADDAGR